MSCPRAGSNDLALFLFQGTFGLTVAGEADGGLSDARREVLELPRKHPEGLRQCEIVKELGRSQQATSRLLRSMSEAGLIGKEAGLWAAGK